MIYLVILQIKIKPILNFPFWKKKKIESVLFVSFHFKILAVCEFFPALNNIVEVWKSASMCLLV